MYKHLFFPLFLCGLSFGKTFAQNVPQLMQYQAVARDGSGVITNQEIAIQVTILKNNMNGDPVYREEHGAVQTNEFGLFSLRIGGGTVLPPASSFSAIDWGADTYWLRIGFRPPGGSDFLLLNATQLLSVPYALFAGKAANATGGDPDSTNELQTLTQNGLIVTLSQGGGTISVADNDNDPNNEIQTLSKTGNTVTLSKNGGSFTDDVNDADASPTNELQTLSLSGNSLVISNGNTVSLAGIGSQWLNNPNGIHYGAPNGYVGIGESNPEHKFVVRGVNADADENLISFRKDHLTSGATRNFLVKMRPAVPEVLLTTDGSGVAHPRLSLGAGAQASHMTILTNANVGVGTNDPQAGLDVVRSQGFPALRVTKTAGPEHVAVFRRDPDPGYEPVMVMTRQGFVGIGTNAPSQELHVVGSICYTGSNTACSDSRYKHDFQPIVGALEKLRQINGRYYYWNQASFPQKKFSDQRQIGVVAQEVEQYFPELVFTDPDGYKSVDYARLTPVLIEAIKAQQVQIEQLTARLEKIEHSGSRK